MQKKTHRTLAAVGVFVVTLALSLSADSALAQGRGHEQKPAKPAKPVHDVNHVKPVPHVDHAKPVPHHKPVPHAKPVKPAKPKVVAVAPVFVTHDRDIITHYYAQHSAMPRHGELPPGLERQLQRNGILPVGLRAKLIPLPAALETQLVPLPYGYRRGLLDRHVVVYRTGTYLIGDSILYVLK